MLFDDTYKMILEELDSSFSQLFKYRGCTASATQQGPVRYGTNPEGFKGGKDGITSYKVDGKIFPQTENMTRKELKQLKQKSESLKQQRLLNKKIKELKKN